MRTKDNEANETAIRRKWCNQYGEVVLEVVRKDYKDHVNEIKSMSIAINKETKKTVEEKRTTFDDVTISNSMKEEEKKTVEQRWTTFDDDDETNKTMDILEKYCIGALIVDHANILGVEFIDALVESKGRDVKVFSGEFTEESTNEKVGFYGSPHEQETCARSEVLEDAGQRVSVSEEASRAFGRSQTYRHKGCKLDLLDRQALGVVRLSLAKNIAYNIVNEKTTYDLFKALSNMYEKPSASNKVFFIRQLVNTKMKEGTPIADYVNEFNLNLSRLMSVDIKFDDEVQALLLLSLFPESWLGIVTTVSGSTGTTKLKFDNISDLILGEDIRSKTFGEYSNSLLSALDKGRGRKQDRGQKQNRGRLKSTKRALKDKEVNMADRDYDDVLVCCVENTIEDRIMDSSASFHATFCKEELVKFRLRSGKVCLSYDKTLDIAGVGDVVLKSSFGTSWTLKDVRYIPGLKMRLISIVQLDEEGYHVGFEDQKWKVTKGSLVVARANKRESLYMAEVPSDGINATIDGRGNTALWHQRLGHMSEKGMNIQASKGGSRYYVTFIDDSSKKNEIRMLKTVPKIPQQNGVAERMNRTMNERAKTMRLHVGLPKMFWEDSVTTTAYLINRGPSVEDVARDKLNAKYMKCTFIGYGSDEIGYHFWDSKGQKVVRSRDVTFNKDSLYGAKAVTGYSNLTKPNQKDQVVLEESLENLANKSIVSKHGSFEDSGRSYEEDSEDGAFSDEGGSETLQSKWVFKVKEKQDGSKRHKARLVVKGFQQKRGVDYNEIFSPVVKITTIRLVFSIVAAKDLHQEQLDVKTDFLHGYLDEYIYMTQPEGFQSAGKEENLVCKLKKSLYGLKQAPRQWYLKFDSFIHRTRYKRCAMDNCFYLKKFGSSLVILLLYVDDMLVAGSDMAEIKKIKRQLSQEFKMKDLGYTKQILGMNIIRDKTNGSLRISQEKYIDKVLEKFNMKDAEARLVGSVIYVMVCIRPDIAHAVGVVSRFMSNPGREHWEAVKWLLCYLKGTSKATLYFSRKEIVLEGFSDSDYGGCLDLGKSTTCYVFTMGEAAKIKRVLFCDNRSAIHLAKNLVSHGRTKHIKIRYHYIRELVSEGTLSLKKILGANNPADMLTKVVTTEKLKLCAASTGLRDN
ncbi:retrovirus-related pol polyprotein from transposon TNT 1-94 [Tanacetum coccineum]